MSLSKIIYIIIGFLSLGLSLVGVLLPILPTTPFLLLTSFCFTKGSTRFHEWFTHSSLYKKHLESFVTERSMHLKTKICILTIASTMLLFPLILVDVLVMRVFILGLYCLKYYYFIFKTKTL